MKKNLFVVVVLLLSISFTSCQSQYPELEKGAYAEFVTNKGTFVAKLHAEQTPLTVANFVSLAKGTNSMVDDKYKGKKFYDSLVFHRIIKDFMIQGGDPLGTGAGNPGYKFPDEFVPELTHSKKGILSMANSGPATNGSQFFITLKETPWLNGRHTIFGEIVLGQEVVDSLGVVKTEKDRPLDDVIIETVNIIEKGIKVPSFETEMEKIELEKRKKEEAVAKVAIEKIKELDALKAKAETLESGLMVYFNEKNGGEKPTIGANVKMNYAGYFTDGKLFDSNRLEVAEQFMTVDENRKAANQYVPVPTQYSPEARLIPGFREALLTMNIGDKITAFIPSHLAYGERGIPNVIPPNSDLIFELELTEIVPAQPNPQGGQ